MRRVAAKLGLGFAEKIKIGGGGGRFMRRSLSSLSEAVGSEKKRFLYLCFVERSGCGDVITVIRPINLKLISDDDDDDEKWLPDTVYQSQSSGKDRGQHCGFSSRFGSGIVFPTGTQYRHMTHFTCLYMQPQHWDKIPSTTCNFSTPKFNPILGELDSKLYCIATSYSPNPDLHRFQVLMPDLSWRLLDPPPFDITAASFLEGSNKIIGWKRSNNGVYCFDTTNPEIGWTESTFSGLSTTLPFQMYCRPPLFIPVLGTFHVMFVYDHVGLLVTPFLMSDSDASFQPKQPLTLPKFCSEYNDDCPPNFIDHDQSYISYDYEFVNLGDQKVCLVLNKYVPSGHDHHQYYGTDFTHANLSRETGFLLLVTFEYDIVTTIINNSKPTVEIQTRLLTTHRFRYQPNPRQVLNIDSVRMTGVILLNN